MMTSPRWFDAEIHLLCRATGERRVLLQQEAEYPAKTVGILNGRFYEMELPGFEWSDSNWRTGNYSCRCNREIFWRRAGHEDDDHDLPCAEGIDSYLVEKIVDL